MSEAVVSSVVQTLTDLFKEETKFVAGVDGQVQGITHELKMLQSFLKDADARQIEGDAVRTWVEGATEVAYHAEDVLETYVLEVQSKRRGGIINILKRYACLLNECILLHKIGKEAQDITTRISQLTDHLDKYGIRRTIMEGESSSSAQERLRQLRRSYSHVVEEDFVGFERDVENLVVHLVNEERDNYYQVVSIVGMGGLGKTTLAQKIYNHPNVKRHFDMLVWVSISQKWEANDVLRRILLKFIPERREDIMKWIDDELFRQLLQIQQNRRCLIVLDDVWSTDVWIRLAPGFLVGKTGSKVLLTTRNEEVTLQIDRQVFRHQPRLLNDDESWELLQKKALRRGEDPSYIKKMELGREMVKHCGGLPLAVVVLGGLLATKEALSEWDMIHKNVKSYLSRGKSTEHGGRVVDILALSYDDLPYQLKPCFLYLGNFEEDSEIEVERLYQLWMAEGMVSLDDKSEEETMMDVAERYLGELAQRCIVQVQVEEESSIRRFSSCRLHDLMRELCLSKGKEDNFLKVIDYRHGYDYHEPVESSASINNTCRLSIYLGGEDVSRYVSPEKKTVRHLRSLLVFISNVYVGRMSWMMIPEYVGRMSRMMISQFKDFKMLRVLAIERLYPERKGGKIEARLLIDHWKLLKGIGNLIHLRYLSLRGSLFLKFPSSFGNLKQLQTLDLRDVFSVALWKVKVLRKMGRLRHLYLPNFKFHRKFIGKVRLGGLNKLEILENFDPAYCEVKDLSTLSNLRELTTHVEEKPEDLRAIILHVGNITQHHLRNLSLNIKCRFCSEDELTLLTQLLGCPVLHNLVIDGTIGKLPEHTHFSSSLTQLSLNGSELEEDPMTTLEKLPNLHGLSLMAAFIGEEIVCSAMGFPQLKKLQLVCLDNLQKWRVDKGAMPNLSTLTIWCCLRLQRVPEGLKFNTTLQELVICSMLDEFTERIQIATGQEGEDFDRVRHIPSIIFL